MADRNTCCAELNPNAATVLPFRSLIVRTRFVPNNSKQLDVNSGQDDDRIACVKRDHEWRGEVHFEVGLPSPRNFAPYSKCPSSGVNRSSWKFFGLSWRTCLR